MSEHEFAGTYETEPTHPNPAVPPTRQASPTPSDPGPLEFPGCWSRRLTARQLEALEEDPGSRFEYWDRDTETVWMVREPATDAHERPGCRLVECCQVIAASRGSGMTCMGAMDLWLPDERGARRKILQADQCVYLHPADARLPEGHGMTLGVHDFPDVVLEVDHTTDVRRGKLKLYEAWGFPEIWVEVPDRYTRSRRPGARPGVTIWLRGEDGGYRESPASGAFPGWRTDEIHAALGDAPWTEGICETLDRVGRGLGAAEGTTPDDLVWVRRHRTEGRAEGVARERARIKDRLMAKVLGPDYPHDTPVLVELPDEEIVDLLLECADESEFHARAEALRQRHRATSRAGTARSTGATSRPGLPPPRRDHRRA